MVDVQIACARAGVPSAMSLRRWARAALAGSRGPAELTVRVVGEAEGAALNRAYRGGAGATNVLSFPVEAPEAPGLALLGDVVICAPVVAREARAQGKPARAHFAHMVVHGALHLVGHDHAEARAARRMERLERDILAGLGFPDPYAGERAP